MAEAVESSPTEISAEQLKTLIDTGEPFTLVDTRDDESFDSWRIANAVQYFYKPSNEFDAASFTSATGLTRDDPIVTICAKGKSSGFLAEELVDAGFTDVRHVEDGMRAWSGVYDTAPVEIDGRAVIVQLQRRAKGCLGYLVADPETKRAAAIDPTRHTDTYVEAADDRGWTIQRVLDTHVHADHISGARILADELDVPYHLGGRVTERDVAFEYEPIPRNDVVNVGRLEIKAVFTPGHTSEMASYLVDSDALLTGDTAFVDGVGRTELQFGNADAVSGAKLLYDSLHGTVLAEPDPITVLPGHFDVPNDGEYDIEPGIEVSTTIRRLRTTLPIVRRDRETFVERIVQTAPEKPPNYERIIAINRGRTTVESDEAIELELGPNRCAAE